MESVHGLDNRMLASNAQGLGFSPQCCKSKLCEEVALVGFLPFLPSPRKCLRWNLLNKTHPASQQLRDGFTELEETLVVCSEPPPLSRDVTTKSRRSPGAQCCSGLEDTASLALANFSSPPSSDPNQDLLHCIGVRIKYADT